MIEGTNYKTWTDIIDQIKYNQTGIALLYRNPRLRPSSENIKFDPAVHLYSLDPGDNYLFDQKPIAFGFTAYIGHDEIKSGENSLRSNRKPGNLGFQTLDYYRNYSTKLFEKYSQNDKKKARPKPDKRLQIDFYSELLIAEQKHLEISHKFYSESQNEEDHTEKEELKEYVDAFFEWIEERLYELNPLEHYPRGLGGLSLSGANYIYKVFLGKHIHSKTKNKDFTAIFRNTILPDGWKRVEWEGTATDLTRFINQVFNSIIPIRVINRYFKTKKDNLHPHNRAVKDKPEINEIVNHAKTLRDR